MDVQCMSQCCRCCVSFQWCCGHKSVPTELLYHRPKYQTHPRTASAEWMGRDAPPHTCPGLWTSSHPDRLDFLNAGYCAKRLCGTSTQLSIRAARAVQMMNGWWWVRWELHLNSISQPNLLTPTNNREAVWRLTGGLHLHSCELYLAKSAKPPHPPQLFSRSFSFLFMDHVPHHSGEFWSQNFTPSISPFFMMSHILTCHMWSRLLCPSSAWPFWAGFE